MKKDKTSKKYTKAEVTVSSVNESYGDGGVIFADIRVEFPEISGCGAAETVNRFYAELRDRLCEYAAGHLRELGESEFSSLGAGVARFRFRRYSLSHTFRVTWSDERYLSILRTMRLTRGSKILSERSFGEVIDTARGRFVPPETFISRGAIRRTFAAEPRVKVNMSNKFNFYTDGCRIFFLFGGERSEMRSAELC